MIVHHSPRSKAAAIRWVDSEQVAICALPRCRRRSPVSACPYRSVPSTSCVARCSLVKAVTREERRGDGTQTLRPPTCHPVALGKPVGARLVNPFRCAGCSRDGLAGHSHHDSSAPLAKDGLAGATEQLRRCARWGGLCCDMRCRRTPIAMRTHACGSNGYAAMCMEVDLGPLWLVHVKIHSLGRPGGRGGWCRQV